MGTKHAVFLSMYTPDRFHTEKSEDCGGKLSQIGELTSRFQLKVLRTPSYMKSSLAYSIASAMLLQFIPPDLSYLYLFLP